MTANPTQLTDENSIIERVTSELKLRVADAHRCTGYIVDPGE